MYFNSCSYRLYAGIALHLLKFFLQFALNVAFQESSIELPSVECLFLTPRERPANLSSVQVYFPGRFVPGAKCCWISFPGKYVAGWDAITNNNKSDSVACVFIPKGQEGPGLSF